MVAATSLLLCDAPNLHPVSIEPKQALKIGSRLNAVE